MPYGMAVDGYVFVMSGCCRLFVVLLIGMVIMKFVGCGIGDGFGFCSIDCVEFCSIVGCVEFCLIGGVVD